MADGSALVGFGLGRRPPMDSQMLDFAECDRARVSRDRRYDGKFFTGVRTTGIYCRPVCPVHPARSRNVEFHPSAAAAEAAGFRPCLRCRPEAALFSPAWNGARTTVERALRLIAQGALDGHGVETSPNDWALALVTSPVCSRGIAEQARYRSRRRRVYNARSGFWMKPISPSPPLRCRRASEAFGASMPSSQKSTAVRRARSGDRAGER